MNDDDARLKELIERDRQVVDQLDRFIGKVTGGFAYMEGLLNSALSQMINGRLDAAGELVVNYLTFTNKVRLFVDLVDLRVGDASKRSELLELAKDMHRTNDVRNEIVHGLWYHNAKGEFSKASPKTKVSELAQYGVKPYPAERFEAAITLIRAVLESIESFRSYYWVHYQRSELGLGRSGSSMGIKKTIQPGTDLPDDSVSPKP